MNAWNTGLTAQVKVNNTGTAATSGWSLRFTLPSGQAVTSSWGASLSSASGQVTATPASFNTTINANSSVTFGLQAGHTGNTGEPTSFALDETACAVV